MVNNNVSYDADDNFDAPVLLMNQRGVHF